MPFGDLSVFLDVFAATNGCAPIHVTHSKVRKESRPERADNKRGKNVSHLQGDEGGL